MPSLMAILGLDTNPFEQGLHGAESKGMEAGHRIVDGFAEVLKTGLAAAGVGLTIEGIKRTIESAVEAGEKIYVTSERLGASAVKVQELSYSAKMAGTDIDFLVTKFDKLDVAVEKAQDGGAAGKKMEEAFKRLGVTLDDLKGKNAQELFSQIAQHVASMEPSMRQSADMIEVFGKGATGLVPVMKEMADSSGVFKDNMSKLALSDEDVKRLHDLGKEIGGFGTEAKVAVEKMVSSFAHPLDDIAKASFDVTGKRQAAQEYVQSFQDWLHATQEKEKADKEAFEANQTKTVEREAEQRQKAAVKTAKETFKLVQENEAKEEKLREGTMTKQEKRAHILYKMKEQRGIMDYLYGIGEGEGAEKARGKYDDLQTALQELDKPEHKEARRQRSDLNNLQRIGAYAGSGQPILSKIEHHMAETSKNTKKIAEKKGISW